MKTYRLKTDEAITILRGIQADNLNLDDAYTKDKYDALTMAIELLEIVSIPEGATNGDIIKTIFPNMKITLLESYVQVMGKNYEFNNAYPLEWWSAPYKNDVSK